MGMLLRRKDRKAEEMPKENGKVIVKPIKNKKLEVAPTYAKPTENVGYATATKISN